VRLVVLASWTFVDDEQGHHTFGKLMEHLDVGPFGARDVSGDATTDAYLNNGYVPVEYQPRDQPPEGAPTFAWYRGPLAPHHTKNLQTGPPFTRADAALVLDPKTGLLDLSYAAAWQLGRLLAMASTSFADGLRLLLDTYAKDLAFDAAKDLANEFVVHQADLGALWRAQLQALVRTMRKGQLDLSEREGLLNGLTGAGLSRRTAEAVVAAFEEADGDALASRLTKLGLGLSSAQLDDLTAISRGDPTAANPELVADDELLRWLARLAMLYPVPFHYLAAHERLLPAESFRFFYIDDNWVEALLDGSLSIALECSWDARALADKRPTFRPAISQLVSQYRRHQRGLLDVWKPDANEPGTYMDEVKSGFLLRSAAVAGWPGMDVQCFVAEKSVPLVRMDHLAPDVLLCLVEGRIDKVVLTEPAEGVRFGIDTDGAIPLRHWRSGGVGGLIGKDATVMNVEDNFARSGPVRGVLKVAELAADLANRVAPLDKVDDAVKAEFRSAAFALQMLCSPESQAILWK
jgi:hypothetical protein